MQLSGHAWIIRGSHADTHTVREMVASSGISVADVDVWSRVYDTFGIDDAHDVASRSALRGLEGSRLFIIAATNMTNEAQNALLKTLEEPRGNSYFALIVSQPHLLLETVRSRARIVELSARAIVSGSIEANAFLSTQPADRLDMLKVFTVKKDDEGYDTTSISQFVSDLERAISEIADRTRRIQCARELYLCTQYLNDRGALIKTILEGLAVLLPVV